MVGIRHHGYYRGGRNCPKMVRNLWYELWGIRKPTLWLKSPQLSQPLVLNLPTNRTLRAKDQGFSTWRWSLPPYDAPCTRSIPSAKTDEERSEGSHLWSLDAFFPQGKEEERWNKKCLKAVYFYVHKEENGMPIRTIKYWHSTRWKWGTGSPMAHVVWKIHPCCRPSVQVLEGNKSCSHSKSGGGSQRCHRENSGNAGNKILAFIASDIFLLLVAIEDFSSDKPIKRSL